MTDDAHLQDNVVPDAAAPKEFSSLDFDTMSNILARLDYNSVVCVNHLFMNIKLRRVLSAVYIQRAWLRSAVYQFNTLYNNCTAMSEAETYPGENFGGAIVDVDEIYHAVIEFWADDWCEDVDSFDLTLMVTTVMINLWDGRDPFYLHECRHPFFGLAPVPGMIFSEDIRHMFLKDFKDNISCKIRRCTTGEMYWHNTQCRTCWGITDMGYDGETGSCCRA